MSQDEIMSSLEERHLNPEDELTEEELELLIELREIEEEYEAELHYASFYSY
mgnify:CR=1 FL=1